MSTKSAQVKSTRFMNEILGTFTGVFQKMGIPLPDENASYELSLDEIQLGRTISLDDLEYDNDSPLRLGGRRIALYIPLNQNPSVHVSFCVTLAAMQTRNRDDRYVASLPTPEGFRMENDRYRWLHVCKNCLNLENRRARNEYGRKAVEFTSESILALILAEFTTAPDQRTSAVQALRARENKAQSLHALQRKHDDAQEFLQLSSNAQKMKQNADIIESLCREKYYAADKRLLQALAASSSVEFVRFENDYGTASERKEARRYFDNQSWGPKLRIRVYNTSAGPLFALSSEH